MHSLICTNCGKTFERRYRKRDLEYKNHFCCKECESEFRKGKLTRPHKKNNIILKDDYAIIEINNNVYGKFECLIDLEDVEKIKDYFWNIRKDKRHPKCTPYVESTQQINEKLKRIHLHRYLTNCPKDMVVDHINGNNLDNRKCNLRIITQQKNTLNRNNSENVGVSYIKRDKTWIAYITINGKTKRLGSYSTKEGALERRNQINNIIKNGNFEKLKNLKCEKRLQKNNTTGYVGISKAKNRNTYQVHYKNKYLGTVKSIAEGIKLRNDYINSLNPPLPPL